MELELNPEKLEKCGFAEKRWENLPDENNGINTLNKGKVSTEVQTVLFPKSDLFILKCIYNKLNHQFS